MAVDYIEVRREVTIRSLRGPLTAMLISSGLMAATSVVLIVDLLRRIHVEHQIRAFNNHQTTESATTLLASAHRADHRVHAVALLSIGTYLLLAVCTIVWFHRAYSNLVQLGAYRLRRSEGWAIGGWFIPFANFVIPKQIANDIWRGSDPVTANAGSDDWSRPVSPLLHWWWGIWITSSISIVIWRGSSNTEGTSLSAIQTRDTDTVISRVLTLVALALLIRFAYAVTARQQERARLRSVPAPMASAPIAPGVPSPAPAQAMPSASAAPAAPGVPAEPGAPAYPPDPGAAAPQSVPPPGWSPPAPPAGG